MGGWQRLLGLNVIRLRNYRIDSKAETTVMQFSCSYTVHTVHILNIPGVVECPGAGKKLTVKCPGAGNFFCANARGRPGGMVRVGIERDIT